MDIRILFLLFMIYSFLGWIIEVIDVFLLNKKLMSRGFLVGPYLPIFGVGALLIILLLNQYENNIFILFTISCVLGALLEYVTSYIMEKIFKTRWWDYSHNKFNLNGRICLKATIAFGVLGVLLIKIFNPFFIELLNSIPDLILTVVSIVMGVIFITDLIVSFIIISNIKIIHKEHIDSTEEITDKVKEILNNKSRLSKRLIKAFPDFKVKSYKNKV